jgi:uncharacterized protein (TIGR03067 family)
MDANTLLLAVGMLTAAADGDAKKDLENLQGTWAVTALVRGGKEAPPATVSKMQMVFAGDKFTMKTPGLEDVVVTIKLDPSKKPPAVDLLKDKSDTVLGIYRLEGDFLTLATSKPGGKERPTEFESPDGSDVNVFILKRDKK